MKLTDRSVGIQSIKALTKSFVAIVATSALMLAGVAFVAVTPASAAAGTHLVFTTEPSATTTAGSTLASFAVTVEDSGGSPATSPGASDTIQLSSSCTLTGTTLATASSAVATFNAVTITTGTSCTLVATDTLSPDNGFTVSSTAITVNAATANKIAFTTAPPATATIGVTLPTFKVSVEDTYGNVVTSGTGSIDTITISTTSAGCSVAGTVANVAAVAGVATFSNVNLATGTNCALTATDTLSPDNGFTPVISAAISVATNTPSKLAFTTEPQSSVVAGTAMTAFAVQVQESNGIAITSGTGATDSITISSTCTLEGTTTVTAIGGLATFSAFAIKTGTSCTLIATDVSRTVAVATSTAVTVLPGLASKVAFTTAPPTTVTTAGTVITSFKVSVEDLNGNVLTSGTGTSDVITISAAAPCTLGGTTTGTAVAGVATFSALIISNTGTCVLTATDTTRALTTASASTVVGTAQAALSITSLKGLVGTPLSISTSGGTGTGTVTLTATAGTAGCTVVGGTVKAARAGTCLVTATKAGTTTYISVSSVATTVTFVLPFKVTRVAGTIFVGRTQTVTLVGSGFNGRPRIVANVPGFSAKVTQDTGRTLRVIITVSAAAKTGVRVMTVILSNGKRTSVRFSLR